MLKRFNLKKMSRYRRSSFANQEAGDKFPVTFKKIIEEKGYLLAQVFSADKRALFWKR